VRLFLVRHGAVIPPKPDAYYGDAEVELSASGRHEAQAAANCFRTVALDAVVSSPLSRARFGAERIAAIHGLPVIVDDELREIKRGRWYGCTEKDIETRWPGDLAAHRNDPERWNAHGGESLGDFRDRVARARQRLLTRYNGHSVALVSHHYTTCAFLAHALGLELTEWERLTIATASISRIDYAADASPHVRWIGHKPDGQSLASHFSDCFP